MMLKFTNTTIAVGLVVAAAIAMGVLTRQLQNQPKSLPQFEKLIVLPQAKSIDGVDFVDQSGNRFSAEDLKGYWSIVFFGFTHCPDVCPTTMHMLKQLKAKLSADDHWGNYRVLMVSVDPARDTPAKLANYVPFFDPEFIGLSGELEATTSFARQLGILFVAREAKPDGSYDVDHGTALILLNPQGEMAGVISAPHKVDEIAADLRALANYYAADHLAPQSKGRAVPLAAPVTASAAPEALHAAPLQVIDAWIRPAAPQATSLAAYFELVNDSGSDLKIVAAQSPQFDEVMIHETVISDDGTASMHHYDELAVPADARLAFSPSGMHLMLVDPEAPLPQGSIVEITLILDDGRRLTSNIEVRPQPE